ncbi:MAG: hypothetical protein LUJ09_03535 [Firmicutes bacterium]|nr:hypothetical protein [Bacillota bacterium]
MNCIKCGRETVDSQAFCPTCQAEMKKYPVKPGTPVTLPTRPADPPPRRKSSRRKRTVPPEAQVLRLKSRVRWLTLALVLAIFAFLLVAGLLIVVTEGWDLSRLISLLP